MKTKQSLKWQIEPSSPPLYKRRCGKCKRSTLHYCSEKFRINGQGKNVDVWLIYKCQKCDNTSNVTIHSRINPKLINRDDYYKFQNNDIDAAWKYAFDKETMNRNRIEADFSQIEYMIIGDVLSLEAIANMKEQLIEFIIGISYPLELKLTYVIRKSLNISLKQLEEMLSSGIISVFPQSPVKKKKVKDGMQVIINREKLEKYLVKNHVHDDNRMK